MFPGDRGKRLLENTVINGDRVFLESNEGGIRGDMRYAAESI